MPIEIPASNGDRSRRAEFVFALLALACAAVFQLKAIWPGLQRAASDRDEIFTAISVRALVTDGLQMDYPTPVSGRPWKLPAELGLYHNAAAGVARVTGTPVETAGRAVSLIFFYLGLPAVYLLARRLGASAAGGLLAIAFWLSSPFGCVHADALTSTSLAVTLSAWWLWLYLRSIETPALRNWLAAALVGMLAAPAGGMIFLPFALAGVIFWLQVQRHAVRAWTPIVGAIAALVPAIVAVGCWNHHADLLKAANPYATALGSGEKWSAAFGTLTQRGEGDFWTLYFGDYFTTLVTPLAVLLLLVFSSLHPPGNKPALVRLLATVTIALLLLLPGYDVEPREMGPLILLASLVVAAFTAALARAGRVVFWVAAVLILIAHSQLKVTSAEELRSPLPDADGLAQAIGLTTRADDLVITSGQDWDLLFAYRINRRAILVPAGRETDLPALTRAVGDRSDWHVGAVILTGRYRTEPVHIADLRRLFNLAEKPLLQTSASDVYYPADAEADARKRLAGSPQSAWLRNDSPPTAAGTALPPSSPKPPAPTAPKGGLPPFTMMSPQPNRQSVPYDLVAHKIDGVPCFFAHAPTTLEFDLAGGGTQLVMEFFMSEGSYTGKGDTDGVDVVAAVHHRNDSTEELFRRHLDPVDNRADRKLQTASVTFKGEPGSTLVIQSLPGPKLRANYDWVYFRKVEIK